MKIFLRYFLPVSYFQATRLNKWVYVAYNGLVEWIPALALALFYNDFAVSVAGKVLLSYLAFISLYEIGYITNDYFSEKFETDPRGRLEQINGNSSVIYGLIFVRVLFFAVFSYLLGHLTNPLWLTFYSMMLLTFLLHNTVSTELRIPSFFSLSSFRFFAPIIVLLDVKVLIILIPVILLNNSLYRTIVYSSNKGIFILKNRESIKFKLIFYFNCLPFNIFLSVFFKSFLPVGFCIYFILIWIVYSRIKQNSV